jgi:BirA family biotin operon repressor/biotin-[acetyl-CoA-carboxylase] ligase
MTTPFDVTRFQSLLTTGRFGRNFIFEASVGSTMDLARDAAAHGAAEGTVAAADEQTAGRGRLGRSWVNPPAVNLASTILVRPAHAVLRDIAMIAPLAICHAIQEVAQIRADIKWPNDVLIGSKKVAGVLIEVPVPPDPNPARGDGVALVGAGINVNFDPRQYEEIRDIATSLKVECGRDIDREALLAAYLAHFERHYDDARRGESMRDRWRERLVTLGRAVHAAWPGGEADGIAEDVDESGALIVRTPDGATVIVEAGDVTLRA